jgi:hypothetical protein
VNAVFGDTSFYLALLDERDALHERALAESKVNRPMLTTEFIILELGNACGRSEDHADFLAVLAVNWAKGDRTEHASVNSPGQRTTSPFRQQMNPGCQSLRSEASCFREFG